MANRVIIAIPVWGVSALAAGSIGAPLSDPGPAGTHMYAAPAPQNHAIPDDRPYLSRREKPVQRQSGRRFVNAAAPALLKPDFGKMTRPAILMEERLDRSIITKPAAMASIAVTGAVPAISLDPPLPATLSVRRTIGAVDAPSAGSLKPQATKLGAAAAAVPKAPSDRVSARMQLASSAAIYGTSAQNAYKVYFPQAETSAPGRSDNDADASAKSPEQDSRTLTKQGNYLFYADAAGTGTDEIKANLKANNAGDSKTLLDAIAAGGKEAKAKELTAPALQKQPLDFGDRPIEPALHSGVGR